MLLLELLVLEREADDVDGGIEAGLDQRPHGSLRVPVAGLGAIGDHDHDRADRHVTDVAGDRRDGRRERCLGALVDLEALDAVQQVGPVEWAEGDREAGAARPLPRLERAQRDRQAFGQGAPR